MIDVDAINAAAPGPLPFVTMLGMRAAAGSRHDRCRVLCPWHSEKHPSCDVTTKDGRIVATCRSCNAGGDALSFAAAAWGMDAARDFVEVATRLAEHFGVRLEEGSARRPVPPDPIAELASRIDALGEQYLRGREVRPTVGDEEAFARATELDFRAAFERLRLQDEDERRQDEERNAALDAMAESVLADAAKRERSWLVVSSGQ